MKWLTFLIAASALQGILLSFALLATAFSRKNIALRWLAGFVGAFSCLVAGDVLTQARFILEVPHLYQLFDALIFWLGPLCFGYVRAMLGLPGWRWRILLAHLLPGLVLFALLMPGILQNTQAKRLMIMADLSITPAQGADVVMLIAGLQALAYLLRAIWLIRRYWRDLEGEYADTERYKLTWLAQLLAFCALMWVFWMVSIVAQASWADLVSQLGLGAGIYAFGYRGLRQPQLWASVDAAVQRDGAPFLQPKASLAGPIDSTESAVSDVAQTGLELVANETVEAVAPLPTRPKYAKTGVSQEDMARIGEQLRAVMATELLFLDPELSLSVLATRLQTSPHTLSQTLNVHFGQSFFEYVNGLRVKEVQRCFADSAFAKQSILEIALASGFASKATFNATFKRLTGQTPSAARASSEVK
jgi:AraC-like DNA-binding protein